MHLLRTHLAEKKEQLNKYASKIWLMKAVQGLTKDPARMTRQGSFVTVKTRKVGLRAQLRGSYLTQINHPCEITTWAQRPGHDGTA